MPLPDTFWVDHETAWVDNELPDREHPATLKWSFYDFNTGGVHVMVEGELNRRRPTAVCCKAEGQGQGTEVITECPDCWAFLRTLKRLQHDHDSSDTT